MLFAVIGTTAGKPREAVMAVYPRHKAFLDPFVARGEVAGVGPFLDPGGGNLALFRTRAAAEAFARGDPFFLEGLVKEYQVKDWGDQMLSGSATTGISPFFIVGDVARSVAFYGKLGFEATFREADFFAVVRRGGAQLMLKSDGAVSPLPNPKRHPSMRWDAFVSAPDPDALAAELTGRGVSFTAPLADTHDGLRGFELADPDGYVLFFGRPR